MLWIRSRNTQHTHSQRTRLIFCEFCIILGSDRTYEHVILKKRISWNEEKNNVLKKTRGIGFEAIVLLLEEHKIIDILENPNYENQKYYIFDVNDYMICVPFVESADEIFLKTIFPSRKHQKLYERKKL